VCRAPNANTLHDLGAVQTRVAELLRQIEGLEEPLGKNIERLYETVAQQGEAIRTHDEAIRTHDRRWGKIETPMVTLTDLVVRVAQVEISLVGRMDQLAESQAHTDQRLNALIDVVDKLVSRNGRKQ